jgi:transposase
MRAYSLDLRVRVFADYDAGMTFAQLARKYTVSAEWVRQIVRRREQTGEIAARPPIPKRVPFRRRYEALLRQAVAECPDLTLEALRRRLGLDVSIGTLHNALVALKLTLKKKRSARPSRRGPTSPRGGRSSSNGS